MSLIFHPLLALIASVTDRELARYVEFLKEENKILRNRVPGQIHTKLHERERLLKLGKPLGRAIEELLTIVSPSTFYRWLRDAGQNKKRKAPVSCGRRKPKEIRELVIQIAKSTSFGYTRILGELRKLGIKKISRQTVRNILKEEGIQPGPSVPKAAYPKNCNGRNEKNLAHFITFAICCKVSHFVANRRILSR